MPLDGLGQAVQHARRERARGFRHIGLGLARNRMVDLATTSPGNYFSPASLRAADIAFHTRIRILNGAPAGAVLHFGTAAHGIACWIDGGTLRAAAGSVGGVSADGAVVQKSFQAIAGNEFDAVVACNPGTGVLAVWVDSAMARVQSTNPTLLLSAWAAAGGVGEWNKALTAAPAVVTQAGAPSGFLIVAPLSIFHRQHPRHLLTQRV